MAGDTLKATPITSSWRAGIAKGEGYVHDLTHIDLFSGIGGFALASGWAGFRTVAFCEIELFCQEVLKAKFGAVEDAERNGCRPRGSKCQGLGGGIAFDSSNINPVLIPDIFAFDGTRFRGATMLTGGFPCQPFSVAGKRRGKADDRHLWPEMLRVIRECRPHWVVAENVSGLIRMELDKVLTDLEMEGYTCRTFHIGAVGVNAPHRRMRVWIVANCTNGRLSKRWPKREDGKNGQIRETGGNNAPQADSDARDADFPEAARQRGNGREILPITESMGFDGSSWDTPWIEVAARLCRVDDGIPAWVHERRVARLKALGNSIVPQVAYQIIKAIAEIEEGDMT
jgi:DNA (cytosine-5)-methyltransferase 1